MTDSSNALRAAPAIAPPAKRARPSSDLWRMLPYLMPYRVRWIAMVVDSASQSHCHRGDSTDDQGRHRRPGAASGPAWPVAARRRGDGCRHLRGRVVVHPAVAGRTGHDGRGGRHPQGPLRPPADPADVVPRPLAVGPAAVANHERPRHDSPIHVVRHGLPAAQRHPDHGGDRDPAGDVLAAGCGGAAVDRADRRDRAALPAGVHAAVAAGPGPVRPRRHPRRGIRARTAGGEVVRPRGLRLRPVRRTTQQPVRHSGPAGCRCRRSSGRCSRSFRT